MSHAWTLFVLSLFGADEPTPTPLPAALPKLVSPRPHNENLEIWELTLPKAIEIGLLNDEITRTISLSFPDCYVVVSGFATDGLAIAPLEAKDVDDVWRFKAEVMAEVRSFETQYWDLVVRHVKVREAETLVDQAEKILMREQTELEGHGAVADVAEVQQRLEQFRPDLVTRTSEMIQSERRLRVLLGLPASDDRRIVPTSIAPKDSEIPDWQTCAAQMMESHPGIAREKRLEDLALIQLLVARNQLPSEAAGVKSGPQTRGGITVRTSQYLLKQERERQEQVVQEASQSLMQRRQEATTRRHSYQEAVKAREQITARTEAEKGFYEEGRITIDRYLDHFARRADAVIEESQTSAAYQIALAALEEAKGTLLSSRKIYVVDPPKLKPSLPIPRN